MEQVSMNFGRRCHCQHLYLSIGASIHSLVHMVYWYARCVKCFGNVYMVLIQRVKMIGKNCKVIIIIIITIIIIISTHWSRESQLFLRSRVTSFLGVSGLGVTFRRSSAPATPLQLTTSPSRTLISCIQVPNHTSTYTCSTLHPHSHQSTDHSHLHPHSSHAFIFSNNEQFNKELT